MKLLIILVTILLSCSKLFGQKITYKFYTYSQCDTTLKVGEEYYVKKDSSVYFADSISNIVTLPDTGTYFLHPIIEGLEDVVDTLENSIPIHLVKVENVDTLKEMCLSFVMICDYGAPRHLMHSYGWYYGTVIANGNLIEYYKNGKIRIKGKFRNGVPIGEIYYYNKNGQLISKE